MSMSMLKKSLIPATAAALIAALAGCGPSPTAQNTAATPPPAATAPAPTAAAVPPPAPAPAPPPVAQAPAPEPAPAPVHHHKSSSGGTQMAQSEPSYSQSTQQSPPPPPACSDCGVIASVEDVRQKGDAGMVGTLGGAAAGGLLGNQFGHGKGKTAMTVLGAVGGAFAGREVQSQVSAKTVHRVTVNMEDGSQRVVTVDSLNGLGVGSKVKVEGSSLQYNGN